MRRMHLTEQGNLLATPSAFIRSWKKGSPHCRKLTVGLSSLTLTGTRPTVGFRWWFLLHCLQHWYNEQKQKHMTLSTRIIMLSFHHNEKLTFFENFSNLWYLEKFQRKVKIKCLSLLWSRVKFIAHVLLVQRTGHWKCRQNNYVSLPLILFEVNLIGVRTLLFLKDMR